MQIDHIFIFSNKPDEAAQELKEFGFIEGSSRVHKGQGTANRKFYFQSFFLEILFVVDKDEIRNEITAPSKLWERSEFGLKNWSPFGLILINDAFSDLLFVSAIEYQPTYFPKGILIDVITNEEHPYLPGIFRLPYRDKKPDNGKEPIEHPNQIQRLTKAIFQIPNLNTDLDVLQHFNKAEQINFQDSDRYGLTLIFDEGKSSKSHHFDVLPLAIHY